MIIENNFMNKLTARVKEMALPIPKDPNSVEYDIFCYPFDINDRPACGNAKSLSDEDLIDNIIKYVRAGVNPDAEYVWNTIHELCSRNDNAFESCDDLKMVLNEIIHITILISIGMTSKSIFFFQMEAKRISK